MNRVLSALRNLFRRAHVERDLEAEVRSVADLLEDERRANGIARSEARRLARLDISGPEQLKEEIRSVRAGAWVEGAWRDVIFGARVLRKNPGFTAVAIITLTLGIGANSAIFSVLESQLWRPLPLPDSERLVDVSSVRRVNQNSREARSDRVFRAWQQSRSFTSLTAWGYPSWRNLTINSSSERIRVMRVASNFFDTIQVPLQRGRTFLPQEENPGQAQTAILSDVFWKDRFAADPDILGKFIVLDGQPFTIVGISAPALRFEFMPEPAAFVPLTIDSTPAFLRGTDTLGRLAPGVTEQSAAVELTPILQRELKADGDTRDDVVRVINLREDYTRFGARPLFFYAGAVCLVLLIACVNTAGLLLARGLARRREFALRGALGATRATLIRQLLVESMVLAIAGGAGGILAGSWISRFLIVMLHNEDTLPRTAKASLDPRVVLFIFGVSILSAVAVGLAPAIFAARSDLNDVLRQGARGASASRGQQNMRGLLVVMEVALGLVLLFAAGIFLGSFERQREAPRGFDAPNTLTFRVALRGERYTAPDQASRYFDSLTEKIRALPGVREVTVGNGLPLTGTTDLYTTVNIVGRPPLAESGIYATVHVVAPNYFRALRMHLAEGRSFDSTDVPGSTRVAIINTNLAREIFGVENPLGNVLEPVAQPKRGIPPEPPVQIIGVVDSAQEFGANEMPPSDIYLPSAQRPVSANYIAVASDLPAASLLPAVRAAAYTLDKDQPIYDVQTMDDRVAQSVQGAKNDVFLVGALALVGLALVSVGVFGTIAYFVQQRTQEFGIRLALGARPSTILRHSIGQSLGLGAIGIGLGIAICLILGRLLQSALYLAPHEHTGMLYGISIYDPLTLFVTSLLIVCVILLASYVPVRRAMRTDPIMALRYE